MLCVSFIFSLSSIKPIIHILEKSDESIDTIYEDKNSIHHMHRILLIQVNLGYCQVILELYLTILGSVLKFEMLVGSMIFGKSDSAAYVLLVSSFVYLVIGDQLGNYCS